MRELPAGFVLRRPERADAEGIVALMNAVDIAEEGRPDSTLEDLEADWSHPRFDHSRDAWIVVGPDRTIVGYAWAWDRVAHIDLQADLYVWPTLWGKGIEEVLLDLLETRGREHLAAVPRGETVLMSIFAKPAGALAVLLLSRGFTSARTFLRMTIELRNGYPAPASIPGIEIRTFRRGVDERALQSTIEEAFADHFRFAPEPHDEWVARRLGHPEFDPDLWLVAWEKERAVGGVLPYQFGDLGWIRELGVRHAWQGKGIGKALLLSAFRAFEARGQDRISLGVDAANASGATRLYEAVGMREEERHDLYRLTLRPAGGPVAPRSRRPAAEA